MTIAHNNRKVAQKRGGERNDVHYTPVGLARIAIAMVPAEHRRGKWLECCRGSGNYFRNFPKSCDKDWCEIAMGRDFFQYAVDEGVDVICSNPPYSIMDDWLEHTVALAPQVVCYLIGINNLTTKRMERMSNAGYGLTKLHVCQVKQWFGMSVIVLWEKGKASVVSFDRTVWHVE